MNLIKKQMGKSLLNNKVRMELTFKFLRKLKTFYLLKKNDFNLLNIFFLFIILKSFIEHKYYNLYYYNI